MGEINTNPPVTWLIPIKNGMPYLTQCLDSIYRQTYSNHKILAWVNHCHDDTIAELKKWIPNRIPGKIISDSPIENLGECRAELVKHADTELLALIDSDDVNDPNRLSQQIQIIKNSKKIAAVGSWIRIIDQNGEFISLGEKPVNNYMLLMWDLLFRCPIYQPTMLMRKSIVMEAKNYNSLRTAQDYDLWLRLIRYGEMRIIESPLVNYRIVSGSVSDKNRGKWDEINFELFIKYSKYFFNQIDKNDLLKLWDAMSPHSINSKPISVKLYFKILKSFCEKNNFNMIDLIHNKIIRRQFLNKKKIKRSFDLFYLTLGSLLKSKNTLSKI